MWIEPHTGHLVKTEEACPSGDFLYDRQTGKQLQAIDRWSGQASGLLRRIEQVQRDLLRYRLAGLFAPLAAGLAGIGVLCAVPFARRRPEPA